MLFSSAADAVGRTPLIELKNIASVCNLKARLLGKAEFCNPAGSVKDRAAAEMIADMEARGEITEGARLIEPTSGNTGIGLAAVAAAKGYRLTVVMPYSMSAERRALVTAYGAKLVLTDGKKGMKGAIDEAERLRKEEGGVICGQFVNPANPAAHYKTTGPEIWTDTAGKVDCFVAGVGTGGTVSGVGRYLKEKNPAVSVIAVEPASSPVLSGGKSGSHAIQGIGAGFVPDTLDMSVCDEVVTVTDGDAAHFARLLARKEGLLAGISSGAALCAAVGVAARKEYEGKTVVVLFPDTGTRYLSAGLFDDE